MNIPTLREEDLEILNPYIPLAKQLGRLAMEFADGRADAITLAYHGGIAGYDTRLLTLAALNGAFESRDRLGELGERAARSPPIAASR